MTKLELLDRVINHKDPFMTYLYTMELAGRGHEIVAKNTSKGYEERTVSEWLNEL